MKLKPIFVCASTILLALSLSACHQSTNQSTSQSTQTSSYESKAKRDNHKPKSVNPFQKNKEKPKNLPKMGEKTTESSTSKAFSSAPIFGNPTKGIVNATVEQALSAPRGQEKEEEIEKPEYLTLEDIKKEEKTTVTPVATKPVENEQTPKPIEKPTIEEDEEESELPIEQPNTDNKETIEPPIVETVPVLTIEQPIIHINEGENVDVKDYVKVTDVQDALVELKVPLTELHVGENQITVTATNRFGNTATAILTVVVNAKPVMTLTQEEVELQLGDSFLPVDYVSVVDSEDGDLTDSLTITNPVDTKKAGTYEVIYEAKDSQGVTVSKALTVHVIDPNAKDEHTEKEEMTDKEISQVSDSDNSHEILEEKESEVHNSEIPLDPSTFNEDSDVPVFYSKIS
ncbi:MAG TPA: DUF5011 domain-containing protein [Candidatus Enterococcus stercoripullorum]|nr:DUF5011 domain-containing protein [Candidatus Enterococcus stercoripullorum]